MSPNPPDDTRKVTDLELGLAIDAGLQATLVALERLFAPHRVALTVIDGWPKALESVVPGGTGDLQARHLGVAFDVAGPVKSRLVVLASGGDDTRLAAALLRRPWQPEVPLDEDGRAAFAEMANIIASRFLTGAARQLGFRLIPSVPSLQESPLEEVVGAIKARQDWAFGARFTVDLPAGRTSGLFVAAPEPTGAS